MAADILVTPEEREFLLKLGDDHTDPVIAAEPVLKSLMKKRLITYRVDLTALGEEVASKLQKKYGKN